MSLKLTLNKLNEYENIKIIKRSTHINLLNSKLTVVFTDDQNINLYKLINTIESEAIQAIKLIMLWREVHVLKIHSRLN